MTKKCRIFISYAHADEVLKDSKACKGKGYPSAFRQCLRVLLKGLGQPVSDEEIFFDVERLDAEPQWKQAIERALSDSELFIFLVSMNSLGSDYCVRKELATAVKRGVHIVPVLLSPWDDWITHPIHDPDTGDCLAVLGQFHSAGLPKDSGNCKAVSAWPSEQAAWDAVRGGLKPFLLKCFGHGTSPPAAAAEPDSQADPAPDSGTELQRMLAAHLNEHWPELARSPIFTGADVFRNLPRPLTARKVFDECAVSAKPVDLLARLRGFVGNTADGRSSITQLDGQPGVLETVLRLTLVAAERYVASKMNSLSIVSDEPVVDADPWISAVFAAACFGFGVRLRPASPLPENFIRPAAEEYVFEQGGKNVKRELRAAADRLTLARPPEQVSDADVDDDEFLQAILDVARDKLGCRLVLLCREQSPLRDPKFRATELGGLSVPVVFEGVPRGEVKTLLGSFRSATKDLLDGLLGSPSAVPSSPTDA